MKSESKNILEPLTINQSIMNTNRNQPLVESSRDTSKQPWNNVYDNVESMSPPPAIGTLQMLPKLPPYLTTSSQYYKYIVQQYNLPCPMCSHHGINFVGMAPGCYTYSWSACLFAFTGLTCAWIPFACDSCMDIKIVCGKCRFMKCRIEKQFCH